MDKLITVPLVKVDDSTRMVYGYASTKDRDSDGEIISLNALKAALPGYLKFATVREMHNAKPIGKTKEASVDDNGLYIGAKIVDNEAWRMVKEEVYSAFSIGGRILERDEDDPSVIKAMSLIEISLVDVPANAQCTIDLIKVADTSEPDETEKAKKPDPKDDEEDQADSGDDEAAEGEADSKDPPKAKKLAEPDREDDVLYKNMLARFGQEKADAVFGKTETPAVDPAPSVEEMAEEVKKSQDEVEFLATSLIGDLYKNFEIDHITALQSTAKKEEVRQLLEFAKVTKDIVCKAGSRHSRADMDSLQAIHDHASNMGAACSDKHSGVKPGDLSKAYEQASKFKKLLNAANDTIDRLNKQVADKEDYIEKLKKTPKVALPISSPAELPEGLIAVEKGQDPSVDGPELNTEQKIMKGWRDAREAAFRK